MPMIPEDIMTGLTTLSASDNMNARQRDLMTEAAACIKYQQHRVREADARQKEAQDQAKQISSLNEAMTIRTTGILALNNYFRQQLVKLSELNFIPQEENND